MKLDEADLTFIAEALGDRQPAPIRWLEILARHPSPIVREGVVYGLARAERKLVGEVRQRGGAGMVKLRRIYRCLHRMSLEDTSPGVRTAAREALEP